MIGKVYGAFVADIQGHGVSAALVTNLAKILFVTAVERYLSPKSVFEYINNEICDILHFHSFFTAFYIVVDFPNNQFLYSAGGHNYNLRYNAKTKTIERLETQDTIIGVINNNKFEEKVVNFNVGDRIIVYTDGIPEAKNQEGEFFTDKRLYNLIMENPYLPADELIKLIEDTVKEFTGRSRFDDDVTIIIIDIKSGKDTAESRNKRDIYSKNEINRLIEYYRKSIEIKEKKGDKLGLIDNLKELGDKLTDQENKDEALIVFQRAKKLAEDENDENRIANVLTSLCNLYYQKSEMDKSIEIGLKAEEIYKKNNNITNLANVYNLISISYSRKGDNQKAKEYMFKAVMMNDELDETRTNMRNRAIYYSNLGFTYGKESNMEKSLEYSLKAVNIAEFFDFVDLQATLMNNIGDIYRIKAQYENALKYFHKGLQILEEVNNKNLLAIILLNTSDIYLKNGEFELNLYYLKKAIYITQKYNLYYLESALKSVRAYNYIIANMAEDFIKDIIDVIELDKKLKFDPAQDFIKISIGIFLSKYKLSDYPEVEGIINDNYERRKNPDWYFQTAIESTSNPMSSDFHIPSLYRYAEYLYNKNKKNEAIEFINRAIKVCNEYQNYSEKLMISKIISDWDIDFDIFKY